MWKFLKGIFSKSKAVDIFAVKPNYLKEGCNAETLSKILAPKPAVTEVAMQKVLQQRVMSAGYGKPKHKYFTTTLVPINPNKPKVGHV